MTTKERTPVQDALLRPNQDAPIVEARARGNFVQTFGLDLRVAILTVIVDILAFSGSIVSAGLLYPVEFFSAIALGIITYKIQKHWYGDDPNSALIKALVIWLITAIPAPITWLVAGPGGVLGLIHSLRPKK